MQRRALSDRLDLLLKRAPFYIDALKTIEETPIRPDPCQDHPATSRANPFNPCAIAHAVVPPTLPSASAAVIPGPWSGLLAARGSPWQSIPSVYIRVRLLALTPS